MMKSLWSGVSGMQAHQLAIDVEGDNIANVNTPGFKYSRANFSNLLSQTQKIATAPQGNLGGTNEAQVGLGSKISSTTRIYKQGSTVDTDKLTDVAIQGDGFFMLTPDDGSTYRYTRNGDFIFDSQGNLVDQNGYKVQGWVKDVNPNTGKSDITSTKVDSTRPVDSIKIDPGLRIPAKPTSNVELKANLNSGSSVISKNAVYSSDGTDGYAKNNVIARFADPTEAELETAGVSNKEVYYDGPNQGVITNHNDTGYKIGTDLGVATNAEGKVYNLQSATYDVGNLKQGATPDTSRIDGQGVIVSIQDEQNPPKTHYYELRYTDANAFEKHPPVSQIDPSNGTIVQSLQQANNKELAQKKYVFNDDPQRTEHDTKVIYFKTDQEFRLFMQSLIRDPDQDGTKQFQADFSMTKSGKMQLVNKNPGGGNNIVFDIKAIMDSQTTSNVLFSQNVTPMKGIIEPNQSRLSESFHVPSHAASINIYDSLGTRYSLRFDFAKISNNEWTWRASVPEPASLTGGTPPDENVQRGGTIRFTKNGALQTYNPPNITFNSNKGSEKNQVIQIDFGDINGFGGITHLDKASESSGIKQDGFSGGSLTGTRIDETGTLIGNFSNDRSFALAKIAMASFTNNSGLSSTGGNLFAETSNSGEPIIGVARSGGKGGIQSTRLEISNVDLTRSLTQLIIIQRGFQANSKSITTSDQMLNTLLQMKQ